MAKRFAEHNGLDLTKTNEDVLAAWMKNDIFHKSIDEREGCPKFIFFEGPPRPMVTPASTTYWLAPSRIPSTAIRPCRASR